MPLVFLVRHAQASFGTDDYDRLSDRGRQQSRWLGEYFAERGTPFARIVTGTLKRQRQTAEELLGVLGIDPGRIETQAGLDEYHGGPIYASFTGGADPIAQQKSDYKGYWQTVRQSMLAWSENRLANVPETWDQFAQRMREALSASVAGLGRDDAVLVVSSGGSISRLIVDITGGTASSMIDLNQQYRNTGICELIAAGDRLRLASFNSIPHLERQDRRHAISYA